MSILNKYKRWVPMLVPIKNEYWDFVLSQDNTPSVPFGARMTNRCLSSYIEFGEKECQEAKGVCSLPGYRWEDCVSEETTLEDIGYTGVDNGLIYYGGWDKVTNKEFFDIFTNSKLTVGDNDCRLHLHQVTGNTGVYSYPMEYVENEYYTLRGGFFQGFYKLFGFDYQVLPQYIEDEWNVEIVLRPKYEILDDNTLNITHPENSGIFFYMGTRAENKFLQIYNTDLEKYPERVQPERKFCDEDYFIIVDEPEETIKKISKKTNKEFNKRKAQYLAYFLNTYGYNEYSMCGCEKKGHHDKEEEEEKESCLNYLADLDYMERDVIISGATLVTSNGVLAEDSGYYEIKTDNKFLTFNRTKYGFTTANWDDDTVVVLTGSTNDFHTGNLFLLMNRTCSGYTTETIDQYYSKNKKEYDFLSDTLGNAFALKRNDDGSISYRYMVRDCDKEEKYSILEETSFPNLLNDNKWATVNIKFVILNGNGLNECGKPYGQRKMKIYIYVNGYLKFISKELPEFDFRELKEHYEKQEGVPFNISVGGGTQGLCDSVWLDYSKAFEKILPIEKNFAGTFIGDIKSFRFYACRLSLTEIRNNHLFNRSKWVRKTIYKEI